MKIINRRFTVELSDADVAAFKRVKTMLNEISYGAYHNDYEELSAAAGEAVNAMTNTMYELDQLTEKEAPDSDSDSDSDSKTTPCETCGKASCIDCEHETIRPNY